MRYRYAVFAAVALAVGACYLWIARTASGRFFWTYDLGGYYDYLGRGFAGGHLYVPLEPSRELLAQPNPWDPAVDESLKIHDMALFRGRYYLYHGAGPAVMLFVPWRLVTGHDLPENFALFLFSLGGFLFACGALMGLLELAEVKLPTPLLAVMLLALGACQSVPYLLNRVWVYEIAIGAGYFCISAAVFFLVRATLAPARRYWLAASGLMFGLAIACRPHLGIAGVLALAGLMASRAGWRRWTVFLLPLGLAGLAIATYNYARFDNPFEFGIRYLLTGEHQQRIKLSAGYVLPGLYFMLLCPPHLSPVFPWVAQVFRYPFGFSFPKEYFIEATVGALYLAPFLAGLLWVRRSPARMLLWILLGSAACILLFLTSTGFTTQRYEVDFLPMAALAALVSMGTHIGRSTGWRRRALAAALVAAVGGGAAVNLALGVGGPYDDILKKRPLTYVRVARWFSPIEYYRPELNPRIAIEFSAEFIPHEDGFREPLLTMGDRTYRHFLYVEHGAGRLKLVSQCDASTRAQEMERPAGKPARIRVTFSPESGTLTVAVNGEVVVVHQIKALLTAPSQVTVGRNRIDRAITVERFTGRIAAGGR